MKTRFELIIFDWDGTLSDSVGLITDLMIQSFVLHNVEPPSRSEVADILGIKLSEAFKILLKEKNQNNSELILNHILICIIAAKIKLNYLMAWNMVLKSYIDVDIRLQLQRAEVEII